MKGNSHPSKGHLDPQKTVMVERERCRHLEIVSFWRWFMDVVHRARDDCPTNESKGKVRYRDALAVRGKVHRLILG